MHNWYWCTSTNNDGEQLFSRTITGQSALRHNRFCVSHFKVINLSSWPWNTYSIPSSLPSPSWICLLIQLLLYVGICVMQGELKTVLMRWRAIFFPPFSFFFLSISWKARASLIVLSGSPSLALPIFIFKTPPGNYWTLVPLVSPIHTHTCAVDLFIKVGVSRLSGGYS